MTERTFLFIVNPEAGAKSSQPLVSRIRERFQVSEGPSEIEVTGSRDEAMNLSRGAAERGFTHVVAVGGDGTIHSIVNGLVGTDAGLGLVPAGSGNDFAKAVQVPASVEGALDILEHGREQRVDIGRLDDRYFANGMGIGMDGAIARRFQTTGGTGDTGYAWAALRAVLQFRGFHVRLSIPEQRCSEEALFVSISNGVMQGGCFRMAPEASLTDGLLDVQVTRNVAVLRRLINLPRWFYGKQARLRDVEVVQSPTAWIELQRSVPVHLDGEPFQLRAGHHRVEVREGGLNVIGPIESNRDAGDC